MTPYGRQVKQLLRLSDDQLADVLHYVAWVGGEGKGKSHRKMDRVQLTIRRALLQIYDGAADPDAPFVVAPIDMSDGGIGFLHGCFLYPGTRCVVSLKAEDGTLLSAPGQVVRCRLIKGHVHDVGVQFDQVQNITAFVRTVAADSRQAA